MLRKKKTVTPEAAKLRMADLCARSEQCEADILGKLVKLGLSAAEARRIVGELVEGRFIDNRRYATAFARDKVRFAAWGRRKIAAALVAKRVDSSLIREVLGELDAEEYLEAAMRGARAKARALDLSDYEDRMKLLRHLASRGFESGVATGVIERLKRDVEGA